MQTCKLFLTLNTYIPVTHYCTQGSWNLRTLFHSLPLTSLYKLPSLLRILPKYLKVFQSLHFHPIRIYSAVHRLLVRLSLTLLSIHLQILPHTYIAEFIHRLSETVPYCHQKALHHQQITMMTVCLICSRNAMISPSAINLSSNTSICNLKKKTYILHILTKLQCHLLDGVLSQGAISIYSHCCPHTCFVLLSVTYLELHTFKKLATMTLLSILSLAFSRSLKAANSFLSFSVPLFCYQS